MRIRESGSPYLFLSMTYADSFGIVRACFGTQFATNLQPRVGAFIELPRSIEISRRMRFEPVPFLDLDRSFVLSLSAPSGKNTNLPRRPY